MGPKDKDSSKICVVLPTYNGAKYLSCQLDSILAQSYENIDVYLRDDGSTDNTVAVIRDYADRYPNIHFIEDSLGNLGCPRRFYQIIGNVPQYDYYAFADQDDIWGKDKIQRAVSQLSSNEPGIPCVYYASFNYVDANGGFIRQAVRQDPSTPFIRTLFYTPGLGFTIAFNKAACRAFILDVDAGDEMHDRWILRCGSAFGSVIYDSKPTAKHVRHETAVTEGDNRHIDLLRHFITEELLGTNSKEESLKLAHFYDVFHDELTQEQREALRLFVKGKGALARMKKVFYPRSLRPTLSGDLVLRILFLFGRA